MPRQPVSSCWEGSVERRLTGTIVICCCAPGPITDASECCQNIQKAVSNNRGFSETAVIAKVEPFQEYPWVFMHFTGALINVGESSADSNSVSYISFIVLVVSTQVPQRNWKIRGQLASVPSLLPSYI